MSEPTAECIVEYPNGKRVAIDEDGHPVSKAIATMPVDYFADTLEVLPDPFASMAAKNIATSAWAAAKFDATPTDNSVSTHAASDALLAIIALQKACMRMIETSTPINKVECETFVEYAKQRLNIIATAAPLLTGKAGAQ